MANLPLPEIKNYNVLKAIGSGSFSVVYQVERIKDGKIFAAKVMDFRKRDFTPEERRNVLNEVRILASINHPNIIRYIESFRIKKNSAY